MTIEANVYPFGQCTWYVASQYDWIAALGNLGNAKDWAANAAAKGLHVDNAPVVGSVLVLQPGIDGASQYGHVACVTAVNTINVGGNGPNQQVEVTQADVPIGNSSPSVGHYAVVPGASFIYPPTEEDDQMIGQGFWSGTIHTFTVNNDGAIDHQWVGGPGELIATGFKPGISVSVSVGDTYAVIAAFNAEGQLKRYQQVFATGGWAPLDG